MSLLSDVLGRAKQDINNRANQAQSNAAEGVKATARALPNQAIGIVDNAAGQAVNAGASAVAGAASDLLRGNPGAAIDRFAALPGRLSDLGTNGLTQLAGLPGQAASNVLSGLGITSGFNLSGPGAGISVSSYSNGAGVAPGNALEGALARSDPVMSFLWYCEPPTLIGSGIQATLPWFYIEEASLPFRTYEARGVYREGRTKNYASKYAVDGLNIGFYMDVDGVALNYIRAWDALIMAPFDRTDSVIRGGGFRLPSLYMKDIPFYILDVNKQQLVQILYSECWPLNTEAFSMQSQNSDRVVARLSFSVGDVYVTAAGLSTKQMDAAIGKMTRVPDASSLGSTPDNNNFVSEPAFSGSNYAPDVGSFY